MEEEHQHKKKKITWDEETIAEHDLERGTRMKIEEPNTPFQHFVEPPDDEEMEDLELEARADDDMDTSGNDNTVTDIFQIGTVQPRSPANHSEEQTGLKWEELESKLQEESEKASKKENFNDKRKHYYNEYQQLMEWREKHKNLDDDEDADEDEDL